MSEWTKQPIKELLDGQWPGEWGSEPDHGLPSVVVYRSTDLDDAGHLLEDGGVYRFIPPTKLNAKKLVAGDILIEASGGAPDRPVGRAAKFAGSRGESAIGANFLRTLRPKKTVCTSFLRWALVALQQQSAIWRYQQQTTGMINLKVSDYLNHLIDTPPLPEQRRIAEILSTVDEAVEQTEAMIAKYQQIKAGLMHDLFTRGVTPDGHLRPTRAQAPHLYRESPLGWIPKEWEVGELRRWLIYLSYGFTNPMPESDEGPYMVTAADINADRIQYDTCRRTTRDAFDRLLTQKSRPKVGDVLLTKDGTLGRIALVDRLDVCINQSVAVLRPADTRHSQFIASMLSAPMWQQKMLSDAGGSTIKHIYITVVSKMLVAWPSRSEELEAISARIESCAAVIEREESNLEKLRQQKQGLMHDLLTGRVRVKVGEPAST